MFNHSSICIHPLVTFTDGRKTCNSTYLSPQSVQKGNAFSSIKNLNRKYKISTCSAYGKKHFSWSIDYTVYTQYTLCGSGGQFVIIIISPRKHARIVLIFFNHFPYQFSDLMLNNIVYAIKTYNGTRKISYMTLNVLHLAIFPQFSQDNVSYANVNKFIYMLFTLVRV